jgi:mannose-6-phosphate isomerase
MTIERARTYFVPKPWGRGDLRPWMSYHDSRIPIGEVRFERTDRNSVPPELLMKLIFTGESHANDEDSAVSVARGLSRLGHDAWYILSAGAQARVAVGKIGSLSPEQLRRHVLEGASLEQFQWHAAHAGDSTFVPAEMFQAFGSGMTLVEVQPRSVVRLQAGEPSEQPASERRGGIAPAIFAGGGGLPRKLTAARTLLFRSPAFMLERITLACGVVRELDVTEETWLFVLAGAARVDSVEEERGSALFLQSDRACIEVGTQGFQCLVAYARAAPAPCLLQRQNGMRVPDLPRRPARVASLIEPILFKRSVSVEGTP